MAVRCCCPPDNSCGRRSSRCSICINSAVSRTRFSISALSTPCNFKGDAMLSYTFIDG
uniref:Uncharacterized protein n=1 Tax=uncultured Rhodospirillales bacterium HF0200_01O14 TaxID=710787 RepID=E0XTV0_9PROT|nr:hypothetical protein [uncultured Rhodospirillales bacterium HF0200_01O14]